MANINKLYSLLFIIASLSTSIALGGDNSQTEEIQTSQKVEGNDTKVTSLCDVKVPASIIAKQDIWKEKQIPEKDDLDIYMINKTGCSYLALEYYNDHYDLAPVPFSGQLEWRVAVRTRVETAMRLGWDSSDRYSFYVGDRNNTVTRLYDWENEQYPFRATPGALAEDRYVPLYISINNGKLRAGVECEPEPWFTVDFTAARGQQLERVMYSNSNYGAKFLYDCPASFTGQ